MPVRDRRLRPVGERLAHSVGMDGSMLAALRVERFLEREPVIWLSTTRPDGAPHLVPTWFAWDGATIVIRSKPGARKVDNLRRDPRAMLALGDADDDFDIGLLEATARVETTPDPAPLPAVYRAKYAERIAALGLTVDQFARTYAQTIVLTPARALGWHGRSRPASIVDAARRLSRVIELSIAEPLLRGARDLGGEPMARGQALSY
jgi:PPOX class probable F420-dependent enzyme